MARKMEYGKGRLSVSLLAQTKRLMRRFGLSARKGMGQHFLIDEGVLERIVAAAELSTADVVVEVGPGLGVLTRELAGRAGWVVAVEIDRGLASALREGLAPFSNVTIINEDILKVDPAFLVSRSGLESPRLVDDQPGYKVVANLPYYITAAVLRHFLGASLKPGVMVIMMQKEVAEAVIARSGNLSLLGVSVQFYGEPSIVGHVPASSFYPVPAVDSAIVRIVLHPEATVAVSDEEGFFRVVRAGFSSRRKQLINSLALGLGLPRDRVLSLLEAAAISSQRRAQTLTLEEWARLWQGFSRMSEPSC